METKPTMTKAEYDAWLIIRQEFDKYAETDRYTDISMFGLCKAVTYLFAKELATAETVTRMQEKLRQYARGYEDEYWWECSCEGARDRVAWIDSLLAYYEVIP